MSKHLNVLVIGATGQQGGAVARLLHGRGHRVRAFTRNTQSSSARKLQELGIELAVGNSEESESVARAAQGTDAVYAMTTFFESGVEAEVLQGKSIADAVAVAEVPHLVFSSVGSANRSTGVPHFESKYRIERHIEALGIPSTIVGPVFFSENLLGPWMLPGLARGALAMAMPPDRPLQQVSIGDIASFVALALEQPSRFLGRRIDIASDELSGRQAAEIMSNAAGRRVEYVQTPLAKAYEMNEDVGRMYQWFDEVGYSADVAALRRDHPETGWRSFEQWVSVQDWSVLDGAGVETPDAT
jgi:uncharacterized protein YbjT (DUF2867 family)